MFVHGPNGGAGHAATPAVLAGLAVLGLLAASLSGCARAAKNGPVHLSAESCLQTHAGPYQDMSGPHPDGFKTFDHLTPETRFDATHGSFVTSMPADGSEPPDPFKLWYGPQVCISGGLYSSGVPDDEPNWEIYHGTQGLHIAYSDSPLVEDVAIVHTGDGVQFNIDSPNWVLRDSYIQHAGDDAVQDRYMYAGTIDNVLVDWAFVFMACRLSSPDVNQGYSPGGTIVIKDSLVALRPQVGGWAGPNIGGQFFKWEYTDTPGCKLKLENDVFMVTPGEFMHLDLDPSDNPYVDYGPNLIESKNNVIVWLGQGKYPAPIPAGFRLTTDVNVWKNARNDWFDRHPQFEQYRGWTAPSSTTGP